MMLAVLRCASNSVAYTASEASSNKWVLAQDFIEPGPIYSATIPVQDSRRTGQPLSKSSKTEVFAPFTIASGKTIPKYVEPTGSHVDSITEPSASTFHA